MHSTPQNASSRRGKEVQEIKTPLHNGALHQSCRLQRISWWEEEPFHKENLQIRMEPNVNTVSTSQQLEVKWMSDNPLHFVNGISAKKQRHVTAIH